MSTNASKNKNNDNYVTNIKTIKNKLSNIIKNQEHQKIFRNIAIIKNKLICHLMDFFKVVMLLDYENNNKILRPVDDNLLLNMLRVVNGSRGRNNTLNNLNEKKELREMYKNYFEETMQFEKNNEEFEKRIEEIKRYKETKIADIDFIINIKKDYEKTLVEFISTVCNKQEELLNIPERSEKEKFISKLQEYYHSIVVKKKELNDVNFNNMHFTNIVVLNDNYQVAIEYMLKIMNYTKSINGYTKENYKKLVHEFIDFIYNKEQKIGEIQKLNDEKTNNIHKKHSKIKNNIINGNFNDIPSELHEYFPCITPTEKVTRKKKKENLCSLKYCDGLEYMLNYLNNIHKEVKIDSSLKIESTTQIDLYEVTKITTTIENNIKQNFVKYIARFVNIIMNKKEKLIELKKKYNKNENDCDEDNDEDNYEDEKEEEKNAESTYEKEKRQLYKNLNNYKKNIIERNFQDLPEELKMHYPNIMKQGDFTKPSLDKLEDMKNKQVPLFYYDLKCKPQDYLPKMIYMMKEIEKRNEKIYNVFSSRSFGKPNYIRFDTATLILLFKLKDDSVNCNNITDCKDTVWEQIFRTDMKCFKMKDYKFKGSIETDGISCSIILEKNIDDKEVKIKKVENNNVDSSYNNEYYYNQLPKEKKDKHITENKKFVFIDPGKKELISCVALKENEKYNDPEFIQKLVHGTFEKDETLYFRYTQVQRRRESKEKFYEKQRENLKKKTIIENDDINLNVKKLESELSQHDHKTLDLQKFLHYVRKKNEINVKLNGFYEQDIFAKMRWHSFINKTRSLDKMIENFKRKFGSSEEVIIIFGDWSAKSQMRFCQPSLLGKSMRELFRKNKYEVYLVNEFRTSCRCYLCADKVGICKTFLKIQDKKPCHCENCKEEKDFKKSLKLSRKHIKKKSIPKTNEERKDNLLKVKQQTSEVKKTFINYKGEIQDIVCRKTKLITSHDVVKCQTCATIWGRNYNSPLNMLRCVFSELFQTNLRPKYLSRSQAVQVNKNNETDATTNKRNIVDSNNVIKKKRKVNNEQ